jgi:hypothetical protein
MMMMMMITITEEVVQRKNKERSDRHFVSGGRKSIILLEGSQTLPARPSDNGNMRVKTLEW